MAIQTQPRWRRLPFAAAAATGLLALLTATTPAHAVDLAGPDPSLPAASGATVASPFAVRSFVLNPALMAYGGLGKRGLRLSAGMTVDARRVTTRRLGDTTEDTAESPLDPRVLPHVAAVGALGLLNLTVGAWYEEKSGANVWFPGRDPNDPLIVSQWDRQRYGSVAYDLRRHHFGLALAWQPVKWLGVGAAVGAQWLSISHRRALATGVDQHAELPQADLDAHVKLKAKFVPLGVFGVLVRPLSWLRLGAAFELSAVARLEGTAQLRPARPDSWALVHLGEASASLRLRLPWTLRVAAGVDLGRVSVDVAGSVTDRPSPHSLTATAPGLLLQPQSWEAAVVGVNRLPLGIVLRRRLALSATVRVALIKKRLFLSAGYGFSQGSVDPRHRSAALVSPDRHLLALGVCFRRGPVRVDVSYLRVEGVVTNATGRAHQTHLVDPASATSIPSGRQSLSGDLAGVTLTLDLDFAP